MLPTTRSIRAQTQTMQWMSPCLLLRKRMSNETLEEGDKWTQEELQKITITITKKLEEWTQGVVQQINTRKETEQIQII